MRTPISLILGLILTVGVANAQSTDMSNMDHSGMAMDQSLPKGAVQVKAVINSIGDRSINVSHEPIPEIGWPAMTMDMVLIEDASGTDDVVSGQTVTMILIKSNDGMYAVSALIPEM